MPIPKFFAEDSTDEVQNIGGEWRRGIHVTTTEENIERMAQGYACLNCMQGFAPGPPLKEAYPSVCPLPGCGYEIGKYQRYDFNRKFRGHDREVADIWVPGR